MLVAAKSVESKYLNNQYYHSNYKDVGHKMKQHENIEKKTIYCKETVAFSHFQGGDKASFD